MKHIAKQVFGKRGTPEAITGKGDTLHVYAVDRLGRDAIDVQTTVRDLLPKG